MLWLLLLSPLNGWCVFLSGFFYLRFTVSSSHSFSFLFVQCCCCYFVWFLHKRQKPWSPLMKRERIHSFSCVRLWMRIQRAKLLSCFSLLHAIEPLPMVLTLDIHGLLLCHALQIASNRLVCLIVTNFLSILLHFIWNYTIKTVAINWRNIINSDYVRATTHKEVYTHFCYAELFSFKYCNSLRFNQWKCCPRISLFESSKTWKFKLFLCCFGCCLFFGLKLECTQCDSLFFILLYKKSYELYLNIPIMFKCFQNLSARHQKRAEHIRSSKRFSVDYPFTQLSEKWVWSWARYVVCVILAHI